MGLIWLPVLVAVLDWFGLYTRKKRLGYLTKPGVMAAILVWMGYASILSGPGKMAAFGTWGWFALGIVFSLFGDVFLMLPEERFIPGLISFALAHLAYIVGLSLSPPPINFVVFILVLIVFITGGRIYQRIRAGMNATGQANLQIPLLFYSLVISGMLLSALLTLVRGEDEWQPVSAIWVSAGAILFYISDILLAWNRYVNPFVRARLIVRIAYHLGQIAIIAGSGYHFLQLSGIQT